jgi:hypothetical protein
LRSSRACCHAPATTSSMGIMCHKSLRTCPECSSLARGPTSASNCHSPLLVAISAQGWRCTHVSGLEYSTIHINCLPPDITGIAASNELFYSNEHGFSTRVVRCAWLLGMGLHVLLCVEGCFIDMMHLLYRLYRFIVLPAHRYCSTFDRWHCHLCVLVQQDINLCHLPCFEDLTKAIMLHVV